MFCVLKINYRKQNLFEKIFGCFLKDEYDLSNIPVFKGAPFYLLKVYTGSDGVDWEKVCHCVGKCASRLIVDCDIEIPENMNIGVFKSNKLYDKMMKNTFINILENNTDKRNLVSVSVSDIKGEYSQFIEKLSYYSSSLTIATNEKEKYHNVCERIKDNTGMCPVLTGDFVDSDVKINANENIMTVRKNKEIINIFSGDDFIVPEIYKKILPDGISKYDFYSALYELCGVFSLGECIFDTLLVNNEKKHTDDIHFS